MQAILNACKSGVLSRVLPALIIASRPGIGGIQKALDAGIDEKDIVVIQRKDFVGAGGFDENGFGEAILRECIKRNIDLISQNGWMVKTPPDVIKAYKNMMVNQHPGPIDPPRLGFGGQGMFGRRVHCAVLYFARTCGREFTCTEAVAQRVDIDYDAGAVLKRQEVKILKTDDVISLQEKVLPVEHQVQIATLQDFANGTVEELTRPTPLILSGEEQLLEEAKKVAVMLFPHG